MPKAYLGSLMYQTNIDTQIQLLIIKTLKSNYQNKS